MLSAVYYEHLKDYDTAWKYANECLQLAREMDDPRMIAGAWQTISNLYLVRKQYKESENAAQQALDVDSTNVNATINLLQNLLLSHIHLGNKEEADTYFFRYKAAMTKHIDQSNRVILADMETKYETDKKEMRIVSLEKARQLYIGLGVAGFLLVITLALVLRQTVRNARKEKVLIATRSVLDGEMRERTRLAHDLHDRLSGNLSAVKIKLGNREEPLQDVREHSLQDIRDKLDNCIRDIRNTAHDLMPASLQFGLKVALGDYATQFPNLRFHFFGEEKRIGERMEFVVYCCASELVKEDGYYHFAWRRNRNNHRTEDG